MRDETEAPAPAAPQPKLTLANENPWYVLMTLYGEQKGEQVDPALHERNRKAWNAWAGQLLNEEQKLKAVKATRIDPAELDAWPEWEEKLREDITNALNNRATDAPALEELLFRRTLIDLSCRSFPDKLWLEQFVFPLSIDFNLCDFKNEADFRSAAFFNETRFSDAIFSKGADFVASCSFGKAEFRGAEFSGIAFWGSSKFCSPAEFNNCKFSKEADFTDTAFERGVKFRASQFEDNAVFQNFAVGLDADFAHVVFHGTANFVNASFGQTALFASARFRSFTYFTGAWFGRRRDGFSLPIFLDTQFEKPTSFRGAVFLDAYPLLSGAVLHEKTTFTARRKPSPDEIKENGELKGVVYWPYQTIQEAVSARESCATIRHALAKQGLPEDEHFFFRREMEFSRRIGPSWRRAPYVLYGWLSLYGYSIQRPLLWLLGIWLLGTFVIAEHFVAETAEPLLGSDDWTAMALSFSNLFPVFGFGRAYFGAEFLQALPQHLKILSGFQTVASLPLLFFLGLGLRQRFRLR